MTIPSDKEKGIWIPPEKLDPNVQRMAWLMFIEMWKAEMVKPGTQGAWDTAMNYGDCLRAAKIVRGCEVEAGSA